MRKLRLAVRHITVLEKFIMECGKLIAKFREAVPVCVIVNGMEVKRLKNVEIPDEIKKLPFVASKFDVP